MRTEFCERAPAQLVALDELELEEPPGEEREDEEERGDREAHAPRLDRLAVAARASAATR